MPYFQTIVGGFFLKDKFYYQNRDEEIENHDDAYPISQRKQLLIDPVLDIEFETIGCVSKSKTLQKIDEDIIAVVFSYIFDAA